MRLNYHYPRVALVPVPTTDDKAAQLYAALNDRYFGGELPASSVAVHVKAGRSPAKFTDLCAAMLHLMVHEWNAMHGTKDVSRSGNYHNRRFKDTANAHGLRVRHVGGSGWSYTDITAEVAAWLAVAFPNDAQGAYEPQGGAAGKKAKYRRYVCPMCGAIVRATREVRVKCADCDMLFEEENLR